MIASIRLWLCGFIQDRQGLAAIEFAFIAPLMLLLYFGMVEFSTAYMANRRANHTASITADLIAQDQETNRATLAKAFSVGGRIMPPYDVGPLSMRVTSVTLDSNNRAIVDWSSRHGTGINALRRGDVYGSLPADLLTAGQSLIIGESHYVYNSRSTQVINRPLVFERRYFLRPRTTDKITCSDC